MGNIYSTVSQSRLRELYEYDPNTGHLLSKLHKKSVGWLRNGYLTVDLYDQGKTKHFRVHRLIWMYVYGDWPKGEIDHINGIRSDNRISNLRDVTRIQNSQNKKVYLTKTELPKSGYKGVNWNRFTNKWVASIGNNKKSIHLGSFDDPQKAYLSYLEAAKKFHTHNELAKFEILKIPQQN